MNNLNITIRIHREDWYFQDKYTTPQRFSRNDFLFQKCRKLTADDKHVIDVLTFLHENKSQYDSHVQTFHLIDRVQAIRLLAAVIIYDDAVKRVISTSVPLNKKLRQWMPLTNWFFADTAGFIILT